MSEVVTTLRSCAQLLCRFEGTASVTLYIPPAAPGERPILIHEGRLGPLPELADEEAAAELDRRCAPAPSTRDSGPPLPSRDGDGELHRIPLTSTLRRSESNAPEEERRKDMRGGASAEPAVWIGIRREAPPDSGGAREGPLWEGALGLITAFAAHARGHSRARVDRVTGLPKRSEFDAALAEALARAKEEALPVALLLLGPEEFGLVNERLDRHSGDRVLLEIATLLRARLRSGDHVARYGGATFTVILFSATAEDGRLAAEQVVRRLAEHRYHGGTLRLEFSAGVAAADPTEPLDAQEVIRRADQALSAARRGQAHNVCVWERGPAIELAGSVDRLQGIFTGDRSKDYRNMGLLLDQMAAVAASTDPAELAGRFAQQLSEALRARRAGVLERSGSGFELLAGVERTPGRARFFEVGDRDRALLERALRERGVVVEGGQDTGALVALPLLIEDRCLGGILLEVTPASFALEGPDCRFLDALAAHMAVALDRARLAELEHRRQREARERLEAEVADLRRVVKGSRLAYRSAEMESVLLTACKVAGTDATILITGKSGTGKELLAHTVHELSSRHDRPFVVVDCSAIAPSLLESDLFGHERGAFTGAHGRKVGRLTLADGATVFLDEIGDIPLELQSKLLRFVQEKQLTPVGGVAPVRVDVRIIAATNSDLRAKVAEGTFREDLFHRLNVVRLELPPLRERRQDIVHLARLFLQQFSALYRRPAQRFTPRAEEVLLSYAWPGNVRELQNVVLTTVLFNDAPEVDVEGLRGLDAGPLPAATARALVAHPAGVSLPAGEAPGWPLDISSPAAIKLRRALAPEIVEALRPGGPGIRPIGKWLAQDLVVTADRLSGGTFRRGSRLLGLPDSTYRRQLQAARRRAPEAAERSPSWAALSGALEQLIRARTGEIDVCKWAEACLLAEIEAAAPGDARRAAELLGVTEPTLLRRRADLVRRS
jgi:hydrogenase-4 transcriptional activator